MPLLTIVFTDVVESSATKRDVSLGRDSGERDRAYLEGIQKRHFSLIRECCRAHGGQEVSTMGDSFCLTFDHPVEAVRCATDIQKRLAAAPIETPRGPLRLRIGIHSGFPEPFEGGWHGTDVDTAARVEATATQRQILLSSRTYELVRQMTDVKFHPRGEFALKGVDRMALWEADWDAKGPRPTAVPPLSAGLHKKQAAFALAAAALILVAAGAAYRFRTVQKQPTVANETGNAPATSGATTAPVPGPIKEQPQPAAAKKSDRVAPGAAAANAPSKEPHPAKVAEPPAHAPAAATAAAAAGRGLHYVLGSTVKLEQLIGEDDNERHKPTRSQTITRYHLKGADLGSSFEHEGRAYFLFGDVMGRMGGVLDTIAMTDAHDPELGVRLDFLTAGRAGYLTIEPPGISMGRFEVPVAGISLGGQMHVVVSTNHSERNAPTDRSVLTKFVPPATFQPLRTISQLPAGRFVRVSMHVDPGTPAGLPSGGPFVILWGTGDYRKSDAYLSIVPVAEFASGKGTRYFAGLDAAGAPTWSEKEPDAKPIAKNGTLGDLSVTWCKDLGLWLMTYDQREPALGIAFSYSRTPWGPWSQPQILFNIIRDGALGKFIHNPRAKTDDGLAGPVFGLKNQVDPASIHGAAYAPYVVERWTKVQGSELDLYYVLSTLNPYVVVLMKSRLQIE
jgi:class 3 adenylate cyclase